MSEREGEESELVLLPLGGAGEIGMNCYLYGWGPERRRQWLMVDLGVTFPGPGEPGTELIFPDLRFIEEERASLAGIVLTHAHEDHFGALADLWPRLRVPVYATPFTAALLRGKIAGYGCREDFVVTELEPGSRFKAGPFDLEYVAMTHSIPEPNALVIRTPAGNVVHSGDWKLDPEPMVGRIYDQKRLCEIGDEGVDVLVCDSTNILKEGHSASEGEVARTLARIIKEAPKRVVVTAFSSNVARIRAVGLAAKAAGRYVVVAGRSLQRVIEAARESGHIEDDLKFLDQDQYGYLERRECVLLCTGSQGESRAALSRIAKGEHRDIKLAAGDMVIFSSFTIPGNERAVGFLLNNLADKGIDIVTLSQDLVHASGHPQREELEHLYQWLRPRALVPMHGEFRHLQEHRKFALGQGIAISEIITNGDIMRLLPLKKEGHPPLEKIDEAPCGRWYLDGTAISINHEIPMRERRKMSYVGLVSCAILMDDMDEIDDLEVMIEGIPGEVCEDMELEELVADIAESAIISIPPRRRRDHDRLAESVRRAIRGEFFRRWGKKPITLVHMMSTR